MVRTLKSNKAKIWIVVIGFLVVHAACADVRLPRLVGDNMVLQRDAKLALWGWADPGEEIQIDFHGAKTQGKADRNGRWSMSMGPFVAGGPYEMTVAGKNRIALKNILIGDVWLASGQSNMEFPLKWDEWTGGVNNWVKEISAATYPQIRLFKIRPKFAPKPTVDVEAEAWTAVSPGTVGGFSAVAYLFGRELYQRYQVPIGLVESSVGGTSAEAWISEGSLKHFLEFRQSIDSLKRLEEKTAVAENAQYLRKKTEWWKAHASEDRGRLDGRNIWAAPDLDVSDWPTIDAPRAMAQEALKGFDGTVWYRKDIDIPEELKGMNLHVHFPHIWKHDETYFNGTKIGETQEWDSTVRDYLVPGELVRAGRNVIALRITGGDGNVGFIFAGEPYEMNAGVGNTTISLAGKWFYQSGPDLSDLPMPSALVKANSRLDTPTSLFNSMIAPLTRYRIKGVIWYQGENNADRAVQYRTLFPALISDWRNQWGYEVPFLFVQLAGFQPNKPEPAEYPWAELREAQSMALSLPYTGMATAVDVGEEANVHPRDKQDVAHRLALAAAHVVYGEDLIYSGPAYQSMEIDGTRIRIKFSNVGSGLLVKDKYGYAHGFEIAGSDGKFVWAQAIIDGNDILVFNNAVHQPLSVRYDWSNTPDGNVFNKEGLPAIPFRTDAPKADYSQLTTWQEK